MKILLVNGPNLNNLGKRDAEQYGTHSLPDIIELVKKEAEKHGCDIVTFQSNHEGALIDFLQEHSHIANGILINPGAFTHYGYSLRDALVDTGLPVVEVHLSNVDKREAFRRIDVLDGIVLKKIAGQKEKSYIQGLEVLIKHLK